MAIKFVLVKIVLVETVLVGDPLYFGIFVTSLTKTKNGMKSTQMSHSNDFASFHYLNWWNIKRTTYIS